MSHKLFRIFRRFRVWILLVQGRLETLSELIQPHNGLVPAQATWLCSLQCFLRTAPEDSRCVHMLLEVGQ